MDREGRTDVEAKGTLVEEDARHRSLLQENTGLRRRHCTLEGKQEEPNIKQ
jgi:hypothetical protein